MVEDCKSSAIFREPQTPVRPGLANMSCAWDLCGHHFERRQHLREITTSAVLILRDDSPRGVGLTVFWDPPPDGHAVLVERAQRAVLNGAKAAHVTRGQVVLEVSAPNVVRVVFALPVPKREVENWLGLEGIVTETR